MFTLHDPNLMFLFYSFLLIIIGAPAVIASAPQQFKDSLLSQDKNGLKMVIMGVTILIAGLYVPDYAAAYVFTIGGLFVSMLGAWIALPDYITDKLLESDRGTIFFILAAITVFITAASASNTYLVYNLHGLINLAMPIGGAMFMIVLMVLSASDEEFKTSIMPQNYAGANLFWKGGLILSVAPFAGANPALLIATTVLATGLMSLGFLVFINDKLTNWILQPMLIPAYSFLTFALLAWSRANF